MQNKKIKIVYILPFIANGGAERVLFDLLKNINKEEFVVKLLCMEESKDEFLVWEKELKQAGIGIHVVGKRNNGMFRKLGKIVQTIKMVRYLRQEKPDIVQTQLFMADIFGRIAAVLSGVKNVITVEHSLETEISFLKQILLRITSRFAQKIVAVSVATKNHLDSFHRIARKRIVVIYNGVDIKKFLYKREEGDGREIVIGAMGRLVKQKGYDFLLEALLGVKGDWECVVAGSRGADEDLREELEEKVKNNFLEDRVKFVGFQEDSKRFFKDIDIFVMPSRWEAMPIVLLEAGLAALPIVATQVGGVDEVIENEVNGKLLQVGDVGRLRECIQNLVNEKNERKKFGESLQKKIVENFGLEKMVKKYEALYLEISKHYQKEHYRKEKKYATEILKTSIASSERENLINKAYNEIIALMKKYREGGNYGQDNMLNVGLIEKLVDKNVKILDFGCGEGELVELLSKKGYQVEGFDVAQINIDNAKSRLKKIGLDTKVIKGGIDDVKNKYDLVVMDNVIEHITEDEIESVVKKVKEKLNDDGQILVITPHVFAGPHDISGNFLPIGQKAEGFHFKEYTVVELKNLFIDNGFKSVKTYFINPTISNRLNISMRPGSLSLQKSVFLERIFLKRPFSCLLKINKKLSNKMVSLLFPGIVVVKK